MADEMIEEVLVPWIEVSFVDGNEWCLGNTIEWHVRDSKHGKDVEAWRLEFKLRDTTGKYIGWGSTYNHTYTLPMSWAKYIKNGTTLLLEYSAEGYKYVTPDEPIIGGDLVEEEAVLLEKVEGNSGIVCRIPNNSETAPKVSLTTGDHTDNRETYGAYISGKSKPYMDFTIETAYGATITNLELQILNYSHISSGFWLEQDDNNPDKYSGSQDFGGNDGVIYSYYTEVNFEIVVTDSRGFTTTFTLKEPSYQYNHPVISNLTVRRCDSSGTLNSSGSYLRVDFAASISSLGNKNKAVYTLKYKNKSGNYSYNTISMTSCDGTYSISGYKVFSATTTASYDVEMTATDSYCTTTRLSVGLSIRKLWSALKNGLGFAFGKIAERSNTLDMGFAIYMNNNKLHGLAEPTDTDEAATKKYVDTQKTEVDNRISAIPNPYPVGAIYISTDSTSPASLFGGTWEEITGRFLLAAGSNTSNTTNEYGKLSAGSINRSAGERGGEVNHKLTISETPSHSHDYVVQEHTGWYTVLDWEYSDYAWEFPMYEPYDSATDSVGDGEAHNNMPPYLVVYMWKRTA